MTDVRASIHVELIDEVTAKAAAISASMERAEASIVDAGNDGAAAMTRLDRSMDQARAGANQLRTSTGAMATANQRAAAASISADRGMGRITEASKRQGLALAENVNLTSELALGFSTLSPATRELGIAFASAGNNAYQLGRSFGPMGVGVGLVIGLLPRRHQLFLQPGRRGRRGRGFYGARHANAQ